MIAHGAPKLPIFYPGHTKWDYERSIVGFRPDVIAQTWYVTGRDRAIFERYESIGSFKWAFVDPQSTRVDQERLRWFLTDDPRWLVTAE